MLERKRERARERAVAALCSLVEALKIVQFIPGSVYYHTACLAEICI